MKTRLGVRSVEIVDNQVLLVLEFSPLFRINFLGIDQVSMEEELDSSFSEMCFHVEG
jgi:hypothetical protein